MKKISRLFRCLRHCHVKSMGLNFNESITVTNESIDKSVIHSQLEKATEDLFG